MITGQPFRIANIRARRAKPGLMRQHLVAVQAAAQVSDASVTDAEIGSQALTFVPKRIKPGDYQFAIGTAGSCTLVLQTILPALLFCDTPSTVRITGGTHNPMAPPVQFLQRAYCRVLRAMGASIDIDILRSGFYPAGGGVVVASVAPCSGLRPLELLSRGKRLSGYAESIITGVPASVARRELDIIGAGMGWGEPQLLARPLPDEQGPGNALLVTLEHEHVTEVFTAIGEKMVRAEAVARSVLQEARRYIASDAAVGEHLADQVMLPMALAGGGRFTIERVSRHARTNADIIARFLPVSIKFETGSNAAMCVVEATA
jgi:RNA 3'-terminal phosphate cyclase (ATP)